LRGRAVHAGGDGAISFAAEVKSELAGLTPARPCCQLSELLGLFYSSRGRLIRSGDGQAAYFPLLRNTAARKVVRLARLLGGIEAKYQAAKSAKQMTFFVELPLPRGLEPHFTQAAARACPEGACDRKAMLRGLFMGCGSVNAPSARYHLEMVLPTEGWATALATLLRDQGVRAGVTDRAGHHVLYVKDGDGIVRVLSLMGASRAVMEFENVRVVREVSGQVNRRLNFETANIDKTIGSAMRQVAAIEQLERCGRLEEVSPALREVARARRANPELNLAELAVRMRLSKSAVNHRLRRLVEIAEGAAADESEARRALEFEREPAAVGGRLA
jgi:DNA-binding protein WhiA